MKIVNYEQPKSSFLSIDKDMNQITNRILDNDRLCKMLYNQQLTKSCCASDGYSHIGDYCELSNLIE